MALSILATDAPSIAAETENCPVAADAFVYEPLVPRTLKALETGTALTIVAVGGASTEGRAAGGLEASWATRFADELKRRFPESKVNLVIQATARQTTVQAVTQFSRKVVPLKPTLVIWETGTTEAARGTDIDDFRATLEDGAQQLRAAGSELVLMDMQYSRLAQTIDFFNRYVVTMRSVADVNDIPLFPRYKIMYDWAEMGLFQSAESDPTARRAMADRLYRCIGAAVAEFVIRRPDGQTTNK